MIRFPLRKKSKDEHHFVQKYANDKQHQGPQKVGELRIGFGNKVTKKCHYSYCRRAVCGEYELEPERAVEYKRLIRFNPVLFIERCDGLPTSAENKQRQLLQHVLPFRTV
uniref:Uncharacterized protein n=1 Tax=Candidatus Kentrum sp. MB TaxID=2138164 RepID=A0A450XWE1_9GAMM|nr:MAG: hypothetical protein BECKMB1821G_GA0114241_11672 [Candidatus Kentron sp. MB]VFK36021.1 MAG: hypothetical protein BECKMB1821I_GA0114274_11812 [Candidatus Kentron sp. MB]VFK77612.1 MAG: hypothetical protein BECKMB1821H_GA0114242_11832 [Candidatus Kentron sp. MB]